MLLRNQGLKVELTGKLELAVEGKRRKPDVRTVAQMRPVLLDQPAGLKDNATVYSMYRGMESKKDRRKFAGKMLRYDITVLPSLKLGSEYCKTFGHYHSLSIRPPLSYPELYEVLKGTAHYLLQKPESGLSGVSRAILVECKAGEKTLIPPDFGHTTINKGPGTLVMDNLVERTFKSIYEPYGRMNGAAYYVTAKGEKPNPDYDGLPELEKIRAPEFNRMVNPEIAEFLESGYSYGLFLKAPDSFRFLVDPKDIQLK